MSQLSKLGSMLSNTGAEIEYISQEISQGKKDVPAKTLKDATSLVKSTNKTLVQALKAQTLPEFTQTSIKTILSDINKLKKHTPLKNGDGSKAEQKESFVKAITELKTSLQDFAKLKKEATVKMPLARTQEVWNKDLVKHLKIAETKLAQLSQSVNSSNVLPQGQVSEVTKVLHKTNMELMKAQAFAPATPKQHLDPNGKIIQRILMNIQTLDRNVGVQIMAGTYSVQVRKLKETLKEMEERLRVLTILQKTRGKQASLVEDGPR